MGDGVGMSRPLTRLRACARSIRARITFVSHRLMMNTETTVPVRNSERLPRPPPPACVLSSTEAAMLTSAFLSTPCIDREESHEFFPP